VPEASELPLFPSGRALALFSFGQPTLLADVAWLQAIQYYGKHRLEDRRYPLAAHLFDVTVRCDPSFRMAYIFGSLVLEEATGGLASSRDLLRRGQGANPEEWSLVFHRGFLEYLRGDPLAGAREMDRAGRMANAPSYVVRLAAHAYLRAGERDRAEDLWEMIERESEDEGMRELARDRLREIRASRPGRASEGS
jgi:hypothetical protein